MDNLESSVSLEFKNGSLFPKNAVFIGYLMLAFSVVQIFFGFYILGASVAVISLLVSFSYHGTRIIPEQQKKYHFNCFFGLFKFGNSVDFTDNKFITVIPEIRTNRIHAGTQQPTNISSISFPNSAI